MVAVHGRLEQLRDRTENTINEKRKELDGCLDRLARYPLEGLSALSSDDGAHQEELEQVRSQFANYRLAVQETLDRRWGDDDEAKPPQPQEKKDNSNYYFESYAAHGMETPSQARHHHRLSDPGY